jgi:hypothetical protein
VLLVLEFGGMCCLFLPFKVKCRLLRGVMALFMYDVESDQGTQTALYRVGILGRCKLSAAHLSEVT